jgi:23S rRNA G2445 N2-methylase RlmL
VFHYYATFVSGMQQVVEAVVRDRLPDAGITKLLDGAILFETSCSYDKLNFFCFNNIFAVIHLVENPRAETALESHMRFISGAGLRPQDTPVIAENVKKIQTFRIVCSRENTPAAVDERLRGATEKYIAAQSRLRPDRSRPDTEFWFLYRREGFSLFMKRLTKHGSFEKTLHPGELPPGLAYMLCRLSEPKPTDIAADPFCGYGSIPEQRLKRFPAARFYASDIDRRALEIARKKITGTLEARAVFQPADVYALPNLLPREGLDAIITDPPWGMYQDAKGPEASPIPIGRFYEDILEIFSGLLKPGGRAVLLTAQKDRVTDAAAKPGNLAILEAIPILVGGKKAAVFVLKKG